MSQKIIHPWRWEFEIVSQEKKANIKYGAILPLEIDNFIVLAKLAICNFP